MYNYLLCFCENFLNYKIIYIVIPVSKSLFSYRLTFFLGFMGKKSYMTFSHHICHPSFIINFSLINLLLCHHYPNLCQTFLVIVHSPIKLLSDIISKMAVITNNRKSFNELCYRSVIVNC